MEKIWEIPTAEYVDSSPVGHMEEEKGGGGQGCWRSF